MPAFREHATIQYTPAVCGSCYHFLSSPFSGQPLVSQGNGDEGNLLVLGDAARQR